MENHSGAAPPKAPTSSAYSPPYPSSWPSPSTSTSASASARQPSDMTNMKLPPLATNSTSQDNLASKRARMVTNNPEAQRIIANYLHLTNQLQPSSASVSPNPHHMSLNKDPNPSAHDTLRSSTFQDTTTTQTQRQQQQQQQQRGNQRDDSLMDKIDTTNTSDGSTKLKSLLDNWIEIVKARLDTCQAAGTLNELVERPRYALLHEACSRRDLFYIFFHQIFCLWSLDKQKVYQNIPCDPKLIDDGFGKLKYVVKDNAHMSYLHISWFSTFPSPWGTLELPGTLLTSISKDIAAFLAAMSINWNGLYNAIRARRSPIMAWEANSLLRCPSLMLQETLFTFTRRVVGCGEGRIALDLNALFVRDQQQESMAGSQPDHVAQMRRQDMAVRYSTLMQQALRDPHHSQQHKTTRTAPQNSTNKRPFPDEASASSDRKDYRQTTTTQQSVHTSNIPPPNRTVPSQSAPNLPSNLLPKISVPSTSPSIPSNSPDQRSYPVSPFQAYTENLHLLQQQQHKRRSSNPQSGNANNISISSLVGHPYAIATDYRNIGVFSTEDDSMNDRDIEGQEKDRAIVNSNTTDPDQRGRPRISTSFKQEDDDQLPPLSEQCLESYDLSSVQRGLHLVRLRSPQRRPTELGQQKYYQYVGEFAHNPQEINPAVAIQTIEFTVSSKSFSLLPQLPVMKEDSTLPMVAYFEGCQRYRFRVCAFTKETSTVHGDDWVNHPSCWPQHIYVRVNGNPALLRRKQHFNHDLPVELTEQLVEGVNKLEVCLPSTTGSESHTAYFGAIEVVHTTSHDNVVAMVMNAPHIAESETKLRIEHQFDQSQSITRETTMSSCISVDVRVPRSNKIFDIPVRGASCRHVECFDLEAWLQTRPTKPLSGEDVSIQEPSLVDIWACPYCMADARPSSLRVDDYFAKICVTLSTTHDLNTARIQFERDGSWTVAEKASDSDYSKGALNHSQSNVHTPPAASNPAQIIVID